MYRASSKLAKRGISASRPRVSMPDWMRRDPLLPEVPARDLRPILRAIGVEYATLNPPPSGERVEDLELLPAKAFPRDGEAGIPNGSGEAKRRRRAPG